VSQGGVGKLEARLAAAIGLPGIERAVVQENHHVPGVAALAAQLFGDTGGVGGDGFAHGLELGNPATEAAGYHDALAGRGREIQRNAGDAAQLPGRALADDGEMFLQPVVDPPGHEPAGPKRHATLWTAISSSTAWYPSHIHIPIIGSRPNNKFRVAGRDLD
jgi:hypothetical protein